MSDYLGPVRTAANAVPPLAGTDLGDTLDVLDGWHAGIDLIRDGLRLIALDRLTLEQTQDLTVVLAGMADGTDVLSALGQLLARITNPDTNPALRQLPLDQQKDVQGAGEFANFRINNPILHQPAANASGAIRTD